jgi:agmatine deiminase
MAFGASRDIWGDELTPVVRRNLADIANAIVRFEPVTMLVRPAELTLARPMLAPEVRLLPVPIDDLWVRDSGPVFVVQDTELGGVGFNFNGWGEKQSHALDAEVSATVAAVASATDLTTELTLEGGALEVDGQGTAILTESCVLNDNRISTPGSPPQERSSPHSTTTRPPTTTT